MELHIQEPIGRYEFDIGNNNKFILALYTKPNFIKRFFIKHLLGFIFIEYFKNKELDNNENND